MCAATARDTPSRSRLRPSRTWAMYGLSWAPPSIVYSATDRPPSDGSPSCRAAPTLAQLMQSDASEQPLGDFTWPWRPLICLASQGLPSPLPSFGDGRFAWQIGLPAQSTAWMTPFVARVFLGATLSDWLGLSSRHGLVLSPAVLGGLGVRCCRCSERRAGELIRCHGDLHLGRSSQAGTAGLRSLTEGEPLAPLSERRLWPARPGMWPACCAHSVTPHIPPGCVQPPPLHDDLLLDWEHLARRWFLQGYFGEVDGAGGGLWPASQEARQWLISLFEIEKAFYEVDYEINNRPDWAVIPLSGILQVLERWGGDRA